jgi:hypothetical protein
MACVPTSRELLADFERWDNEGGWISGHMTRPPVPPAFRRPSDSSLIHAGHRARRHMQQIVQTAMLENHILEIVEHTTRKNRTGPLFTIRRRFRKTGGQPAEVQLYRLEGFTTLEAALTAGRAWCAAQD